MQRRNFIQTSLSLAALASAPMNTKAERAPGMERSVVNAGVGGNNTLDLLERIEKDCLSHNPGLTVLMVGTNDMNSRKYVPIEEYEKNLTRIIQLILQSGSKILLMNLLPVYEPYLLTRHDPKFYQPEGHSARLKEMNDRIHKTADEQGVPFLDLHSVFQKAGNVGLDKSSWIKNEANSNTADGLHPTPEGYRVIGVLVYQHVVSNNLKAEKIVCFGDSITRGDGSMDKDSYPAWLKKLLQ